MSDVAHGPAGETYEWFVRGRALLVAGSPAAAAELLALAADREPAARSIRETWARALFDSGRYPEAARQFLTLTEQGPDDHYAHFGAGLALWRTRQFRAAAEHLTIAVAMRPGRPEYDQALRQVRATLAARELSRAAPDGPLRGSREGVAAQHPVDDSRVTQLGLTEDVLSRSHDVALLDLDGVVYRGPAAIMHAVSCIRAAQAQGMRVAYVTNNAARPPAEVVTHLVDLGLTVADADVVTSAQAGARMLRERVGVGRRVLAVGGPGVDAALSAERLTPVRCGVDDDPDLTVAAVMIGFGPDVCWRELARASYAIARGAVFVATNTDMTIPTDAGVAPGNGAMVAAVAGATGVTPEVAGKPFSPLMSESIERTGSTNPLVVGDRLDTDIEAAVRLKLTSLLVLTGVTGIEELLRAGPQRRPTYLAADLRGLLARGRCFVADPAASVEQDGELTVAEPVAGAEPLARVRAAAAACWAAADRGLSPHWSHEVTGSLTADLTAALGT